MADHIQVFRIENVGSPVIFKHRIILSRALFLHERILPATGVGTGSLVRIPSGEKAGKQATAGIGHTPCPMHKGLNLHILRNMSPDFLNLRQA